MTTITNVYTEEPMLQGEEVTLNNDTYLVEAIAANLGAEAEKMLNEGLKNPNFSVRLHTDHVKQKLKAGNFPELMLYTHHLIIPKELLVSDVVENVKHVFTVEEIVEINDECVFVVYLDEGPYAATIETTLSEMNDILCTTAVDLAKKAGLDNYHLRFNITAVGC